MAKKIVEILNDALHEILAVDKTYLIGEDLLDPYGGAFKVSKGISTKFPSKVFSSPISESGIVGLGIGLAISGWRPIVEIMFGDFVTLTTDAIINHASKFNLMYDNKVEVPIVIRTPMGAGRGYGPTHSQNLETIFFNCPGLEIIAISRFHNCSDLLKLAVLKSNIPSIFVENKLLYPKTPFNEHDQNFFDLIYSQYNSSIYPTAILYPKVSVSCEVAIITYGRMADEALIAAEKIFMDLEIGIKLILPSKIKPIQIDDIKQELNGIKYILTIEESIQSWGWGSEIISLLAEFQTLNNVRLRRIGMDDTIIPSSRKLEDQILPNHQKIYQKLIKELDDE